MAYTYGMIMTDLTLLSSPSGMVLAQGSRYLESVEEDMALEEMSPNEMALDKPDGLPTYDDACHNGDLVKTQHDVRTWLVLFTVLNIILFWVKWLNLFMSSWSDGSFGNLSKEGRSKILIFLAQIPLSISMDYKEDWMWKIGVSLASEESAPLEFIQLVATANFIGNWIDWPITPRQCSLAVANQSMMVWSLE